MISFQAALKTKKGKFADILTIQMLKKKSRKRIKVRGKYMQVRQRSTKKGRKGTIMGKWKPKKKKKTKSKS